MEFVDAPTLDEIVKEKGPLSPEEAADTFFLPPGYRLELVASEPLIADPVWIDIDPDGRVWVVEMRGFMPDNDAANERAPVGGSWPFTTTTCGSRTDHR